MKLGGYLEILRAYLAAGLRRLTGVPLWITGAFALAADLVDPAMPESIWRPREWLWRLWSRCRRADLPPPPGA